MGPTTSLATELQRSKRLQEKSEPLSKMTPKPAKDGRVQKRRSLAKRANQKVKNAGTTKSAKESNDAELEDIAQEPKASSSTKTQQNQTRQSTQFPATATTISAIPTPQVLQNAYVSSYHGQTKQVESCQEPRAS